MRRYFQRIPLLAVLAWLCCMSLQVFGEQRFPPPDFESGHQLPATTTPAARVDWLDYMDVAVLAAALGVTSWLVFKKRSRKGILAVSLFSLVYFGFWKNGCVCAIGSPQNVALAIFDSSYALPLSVLAFFVLPLGVALFAGRAFCAGVCPHGALQDVVLRRPVKVPAWLEHGLGILPFIYLGAGVLFAATGSAFLFCQYDPFVPIFRMNGRLLMVSAGVALLLLGVFVGRPYCRFLCPLGALLKMAAAVSSLRVRVTPARCTQCRLCEHSCPFGAMRLPENPSPKPELAAAERRRMALLLLLVPLLVGAFAWLGWNFRATAARVHPTVPLAERFIRDQNTPVKIGVLSPDELALERARQDPRKLLLDAAKIRRKFEIGTPIFGAWIGLVIGIKAINLCRRKRRTDYEPDQGSCVACARCFESCPDEWIRRGIIPPQLPTIAAGHGEGTPVHAPGGRSETRPAQVQP